MNFLFSKVAVSISTFLFLSICSWAQITVNSSDLPQGGTTYTLQESTPDPLQDYSTTGAGVVWDFTDLESTAEVLISIGNIDDAPMLAQLVFNEPFMSADYVSDIYSPGELPEISEMELDLPIEAGGFYNYYQTSGSSYNITGLSIGAQGIDFPVPFDDIDEIHPLPLNYGDDINSTYDFTIEIPTMFSYHASGTRTGSVDGWGTLNLPNGDSHEVIRLATTIESSDVITPDGMEEMSFDYELTVYQWLGDGGLPYLEVEAAFGVPFRVRYQGTPDSNTESVEEVLQHRVNIFPNPTSIGSNINLQGFDSNSTWEVRNAAGQICQTGCGPILNTDNLMSGAYILIQRTSTNNLFSRPTLFVVK